MRKTPQEDVPMKESSNTRTTTFRWNSRYELYHYFKDTFDIDKEKVDETIRYIMPKFRPRKHKPIKTQELWQKVGLELESICGKKDTKSTMVGS
jgi:hypothetical protein